MYLKLSRHPLSVAEPSRQAPNKRRKRKMSGGSTISGGGGTNNNNNNKKKSPGSGFPLSSQVPVSTSLLPSVSFLLLHRQQERYHLETLTCHSTKEGTVQTKSFHILTYIYYIIIKLIITTILF